MHAHARRLLGKAVLGAAALAAGGGAAVALGAAGAGTTTIGDASEQVTSAASGTLLAIQAKDQTGIRSYSVPTPGGVLTSWTIHLQRSDAAGDVTLKTLKPQSAPNVYVVGGQSVGQVGIGTDRTITFPARIAVAGGDRLSVQTPGIGIYAGSVNVTGGNGDLRVVNGTPTVGQTITSQAYAPGAHLALEAVVEPDADRDGFGDVSQDDCVADAARQAGPCAADLRLALAAAPAAVEAGDTAVLTATVTATGGPTNQASVTVVLPSGLQLVSAGGTGGDCTGATTVVCALGDLPRDGRGRVVLGVRGVAAGAQSVAASVAATSADPAPANNAASATVTVAGAPAPAPVDKLVPTVTLKLPSCARLSRRACATRRAARAAYRTLRIAAADAGGSGVAKVEVAVARRAGARLDGFDGRRFKRAGTAVFTKAAGAGLAWTLRLGRLRAGTYVLRLRATDGAGNVSAVVIRTLRLR